MCVSDCGEAGFACIFERVGNSCWSLLFLFSWKPISSVIDIHVMVPKLRSSLIHVHSNFGIILEDSSRISLVFGVQSFEKFYKFGVFSLPRVLSTWFGLERSELGTRFSMSQSLIQILAFIIFFGIDVLLINNLWLSDCFIIIVGFLETVSIIKVSTLDLPRFHNILHYFSWT